MSGTVQYTTGNLNVKNNFSIESLVSTDRLIGINGSNEFEVKDLASFVAGTSDQVIATTDGAGGLVLSTPQDINTTSDVSFNTLGLTSTTQSTSTTTGALTVAGGLGVEKNFYCGNLIDASAGDGVRVGSLNPKSLNPDTWIRPFAVYPSDAYGRVAVIETYTLAPTGTSHHFFFVRVESGLTSHSVLHYSLSGNVTDQPRLCLFKKASPLSFFVYLKTDNATSSRVLIRERNLTTMPLEWYESGTNTYPEELGGGSLDAGVTLEWDSDNVSNTQNAEFKFGKAHAYDTADSTSASTGSVIIDGGLGIGKKLYVGTGLYLPTAGGTVTELNYYEEGTHTSTFSGIWASAQTPVDGIKFSKLGKTVNLSVGGIVVNSSANSYISLDTALPTKLRPQDSVYIEKVITVVDDSSRNWGTVTIYPDGTLTIYLNARTLFTGGGAPSGYYSFLITYL
ncbi:MAG: hypothetical protein DRM99_05595, partial [Thermoplasmata archaeon]